MQLNHLYGENFMRFERVDLNFPEKGLFCIQGANESGKSTVGSMVLFMLSGSGPKGESAESLINWGHNQMKLTLNFTHAKERYEISRQVDRDGSNFSRLSKIVQDSDQEELLAQGITDILTALRQLLGYCPRDLARSFFITHSIVQELAKRSCDSHLDYMLGLDLLSEIGQTNEDKGAELSKSLEKEVAKEKRLRDEQRSIGYDEHELEEANAHASRFREELESLKLNLEQGRGDVNHLKGLQSELEKAQKELPSRWDVENAEGLERQLENASQSLNKLNLRAEKKDRLKASIEVISQVKEYSKNFRSLLKRVEEHLDNLRSHIGLDTEDGEAPAAETLIAKTSALEERVQAKGRSVLKWSSCGFAIAFITLVGLLAVIFRGQLWHSIADTALWDSFHGGTLEGLRQFCQESLKPSPLMGLPADLRPWALLALFCISSITAFVLAARAMMARSALAEEKSILRDEKEQQEKDYHALLSVDVREMGELHLAIMDYGSEDLQAALKDLQSNHSDVVKKDYHIDHLLQQATENIDSLANDLGLEARQHQQNIDEWLEQLNGLEEKVLKAEERCQESNEKKEKFSSMITVIEDALSSVSSLQHQHKISQHVAELCRGTLTSVRSRLARDLTLAFKELMPILTSDRYASIRFGDDFSIEAFNGDRGDFVPLAQLSSGTNDLFVLIFQLILLRGFMDSRGHASHFIFLDEPLLAVDGERYQKLTDLLPSIGSGLDQIFLCRPPQDHQGAFILNTSLNKVELVADFSLATSP
jgi:DNA repair exonuclease SbcCD ATPase subunit